MQQPDGTGPSADGTGPSAVSGDLARVPHESPTYLLFTLAAVVATVVELAIHQPETAANRRGVEFLGSWLSGFALGLSFGIVSLIGAILRRQQRLRGWARFSGWPRLAAIVGGLIILVIVPIAGGTSGLDLRTDLILLSAAAVVAFGPFAVRSELIVRRRLLAHLAPDSKSRRGKGGTGA